MKPPAHGADVPALQVPLPLQVGAVVNVEPLHDGLPQLAPEIGKAHAPVPPQPVAPQVPPIGEQAAVQQFPVPTVPQTPLVHWLLPLHAPPALSFATQVPLAPGFEQ